MSRNQDTDPTALVLFCRRPAIGIGKRRLAAELGDEATLKIADLLLLCALSDLETWQGPAVIAYADRDDEAWAQALSRSAALHRKPVHIIAQGPGNLGDRLMRVDGACRQKGLNRLMFMGSDAPSLSADLLGAASGLLALSDTVFADSDDGGVTLMGSRKPWPDIASLPWSTEALSRALIACCRNSGLSASYVSGGFDIDTLSDLKRAKRALAFDGRPSRQALLMAIKALDL